MSTGARRPPERTTDGRYVVVDGRRWRATDPGIPGDVRQALVAELMAARRAVGVATRADDPVAERDARSRVQLAKVALGERGTPWWERSEADRDAAIAACLSEFPPASGDD